MKKRIFNVKGMHCGSCEMLVKLAVKELPGIGSVEASQREEYVVVEYDDKAVTDTQIKKVINENGYHVVEEVN